MNLCKDCLHYVVYDGKQNKCHRYPKPTVKNDNDFCTGEFKLNLAKHRHDYNLQRQAKKNEQTDDEPTNDERTEVSV